MVAFGGSVQPLGLVAGAIFVKQKMAEARGCGSYPLEGAKYPNKLETSFLRNPSK